MITKSVYIDNKTPNPDELEPVKHLANKKFYNYKFDFEIGYLVRSPCKECDDRKNFPECIDECNMLDEIHTALSEVVSCTRNY